jgi:hypothetical protein
MVIQKSAENFIPAGISQNFGNNVIGMDGNPLIYYHTHPGMRFQWLIRFSPKIVDEVCEWIGVKTDSMRYRLRNGWYPKLKKVDGEWEFTDKQLKGVRPEYRE